MFLFNPFRGKTEGLTSAHKRVKTVAALYRILSDEFERVRPHDCSCKMPIVLEYDPDTPEGANWRVEMLWCAGRECRQALAEVVARNARLFLVKEAVAQPDE